MSDSWSANGTALSNAATRVESAAGPYTTPPRRTKNLVVPGRHGQLRVPRKLWDANSFELAMWVLGVDKTTGQVPGGSSTEKEWQRRIDELMLLFSADTFPLDHTLPDGSVRRLVVELDGKPTAFAAELSQPRFGRFAVPLTAAYPFWVDTSSQVATITGTTGVVGSLSVFSGATAPVDQLTLTFTGPCNNPQLVQTNGASFTYNGVIASGQQLVVTTGTWTLSTGTGTGWIPDYSKVAYSPGPAWWSIDPTQTLSATFVHTEGGSASVTITGPRAYLTP